MSETEADNRARCEGRTDEGSRCKFKVKPGCKYCGLHINKIHRWNTLVIAEGSVLTYKTSDGGTEDMHVIAGEVTVKEGVHYLYMTRCENQRRTKIAFSKVVSLELADTAALHQYLVSPLNEENASAFDASAYVRGK